MNLTVTLRFGIFLSKGTKTDFEAVFKNFSPGILQEFNSTSFDPAHKTGNENF